jgi:hypothetical protein
MTTAIAEIRPQHIMSLEIENYCKIEAVRRDLNGRHVIVEGSNAVGKTSFANAIWQAVGGQDSKLTPEPIRHGERNAKARIVTEDFVIERTWTPKTTKVSVTTKEGGKPPKTPAEFLKSFIGYFAIDPVAFLNLAAREQVDTLLASVGVKPPSADVLKLTGETFEPAVYESAWSYLQRLVADNVGVFYVRRTEIGRQADIKKKALLDQEQVLISVGGKPTTEATDQDAGTLVEELGKLQDQAESRQRLKGEADTAATEVREVRSKIAALVLQEKDFVAKVADLEAKLAKAREDLLAVQSRQKIGAECLADAVADVTRAQDAFDAAPDPSARLLVVREAIRTSEANRKALAKRRSVYEEVERLRAESVVADRRHEDAKKLLEKLRSLQEHLLDGVDLGVTGVAVVDGELRLNSVPFRQGSQAQRLRMAVAVAIRQKPRLRLLRIDQGEQLDAESRQIVFDMADEHDFQVIMTSVVSGQRVVDQNTGEVRYEQVPLSLTFPEEELGEEVAKEEESRKLADELATGISTKSMFNATGLT